MANRTAWQRLVRIARRQHGLITAAQAEEAGIAYSTLSRWTSAGRLERWYPGVYALEGMPDSWHRRAKAATLAGPAGLPAEHRVEVEGIPVACVARTIVELAAVLPEEELQRLLLDAWRRELVTPLQVATILGEVGRVRGASTLRRVLAGCDPVLARARSVAEIVAYLTIRDAELPLPVINHRVEVAGRRFEIDLAWLDLLRGLEIDGERYHSIAPDVEADAARQAELEAAGWQLERAPARLVLTDARAFLVQVRGLLEVSA